MGCGGLASVACKRGRGNGSDGSGLGYIHGPIWRWASKNISIEKIIRFGCAGIHARSFTEVGSGIHKPLYATG